MSYVMLTRRHYVVFQPQLFEKTNANLDDFYKEYYVTINTRFISTHSSDALSVILFHHGTIMQFFTSYTIYVCSLSDCVTYH